MKLKKLHITIQYVYVAQKKTANFRIVFHKITLDMHNKAKQINIKA